VTIPLSYAAHGLHPVAQPELLQHAGHVRRDRRPGYDKVIGDLSVGKSAGHQAEHLALALGQLLVERQRSESGGCYGRLAETGSEITVGSPLEPVTLI
jgi:hypothetical protein